MKSNWEIRPLGELVKFSSGGTPSKRHPEYWNGTIPWISAKTMKEERISTSDLLITEEGLASGSKLAPIGSLLLLTRGSGLFNGIPLCIVERPVAFNQDVKCIESCSDVSNQFIFYWLKSQEQYLKAKLEVTGIGAGKFDTKFLQELNVPVPPKEERDKIVAIAEAISKKIIVNAKINDNLLAQAQAVFVQRFITDVIDGDEKPLYDFADYINGAAFKPSECGDHGLPIIKIVELKNGITDSTKYFDGFKGEKYLIQDKDILFSWSGNPDTSIDIFIWTHGKAILNQHTFNVKSNTGHRWFTFLMLKYFKPEFSRIASNKQTTGLGHVTATDLKRLTFIFNEAAIEAFEHEVSSVMETIYSNMLENQRLSQLRDTLLPKLMSGAIDVSGIPL